MKNYYYTQKIKKDEFNNFFTIDKNINTNYSIKNILWFIRFSYIIYNEYSNSSTGCRLILNYKFKPFLE